MEEGEDLLTKMKLDDEHLTTTLNQIEVVLDKDSATTSSRSSAGTNTIAQMVEQAPSHINSVEIEMEDLRSTIEAHHQQLSTTRNPFAVSSRVSTAQQDIGGGSRVESFFSSLPQVYLPAGNERGQFSTSHPASRIVTNESIATGAAAGGGQGGDASSSGGTMQKKINTKSSLLSQEVRKFLRGEQEEAKMISKGCSAGGATSDEATPDPPLPSMIDTTYPGRNILGLAASCGSAGGSVPVPKNYDGGDLHDEHQPAMAPRVLSIGASSEDTTPEQKMETPGLHQGGNTFRTSNSATSPASVEEEGEGDEDQHQVQGQHDDAQQNNIQNNTGTAPPAQIRSSRSDVAAPLRSLSPPPQRRLLSQQKDFFYVDTEVDETKAFVEKLPEEEISELAAELQQLGLVVARAEGTSAGELPRDVAEQAQAHLQASEGQRLAHLANAKVASGNKTTAATNFEDGAAGEQEREKARVIINQQQQEQQELHQAQAQAHQQQSQSEDVDLDPLFESRRKNFTSYKSTKTSRRSSRAHSESSMDDLWPDDGEYQKENSPLPIPKQNF